jgi:SAM-dependent methyltransferase
MTAHSPENWEDRKAWDRFYEEQIAARGNSPPEAEFTTLRFLKFARHQGGRVWFPGCGLDAYPKTYAERGCSVLATDFSSVAVRYQQGIAAALGARGTAEAFAVAEQDFTRETPDGEFDVVINCRAYQGLSASAMQAGAMHFFAALRAGGACVIDTINVQGLRRTLIEDALAGAGFYLPLQKSNRWYREQLDSTGILYWMVMGRPRIPYAKQYQAERFEEFRERDQRILDSLRAEYERRCKEEAAEVEATVRDPATKVAHIVYSTG